MNCVQLVGEVVACDQGTVQLAVPREGPHGREPGVVYVRVRTRSAVAEGDRLSVVGYMEETGLVAARTIHREKRGAT